MALASGPSSTAALEGREIRKSFLRENGDRVMALDGVSLTARHGELTALVGPDGAGKTTLLRLAAGLMPADSGEIKVLDIDVRIDPQQVQERIGYMPQRFGLYEDLTVQENLDLYADLHGVSIEDRPERYLRLMEMTGLGGFTGRLAGKLSGGMKQKLGLACTLVRSPELLLLDEPTVGVDPLSRRELWEIIYQLVSERGLTVLVSTSYLDEAERCAHAVVLHQGELLSEGRPVAVSRMAEGRTFVVEPPAGQKSRALQSRLLDEPSIIDALPEAGRVRFVTKDEIKSINHESSLKPLLEEAAIVAVPPRFEDGFMMLLERDRETRRGEGESAREGKGTRPHDVPSYNFPGNLSPEPVVEARGLTRRFGDFAAVDRVSFEVHRGEIFGLLGPNGAGKTTTFRMLCGLLPATSGSLRVAGVDLRRARASARQKIGYVAQRFSLYGQLSVRENLDFFGSAYNLRGSRKRERIAWALREFGLDAFVDLPSGQLPGGYQRRLAMAVALVHEPETLFLDEPTSGADPSARREFWRRIVALADEGVTVIVTTHFMAEAEYCDRVAIMDAGRLLAQGTPAEIRLHAKSRAATMEDAFIAIVEEARAAGRPENGAST